MSERVLNNALHGKYLTEYIDIDMVYELNGRKNICIIGNVITLQIILRNEIPGNNNLLKVTST